MFVAMSKFEVLNGMEAEVYEAFCNRPHLVDDAEGFVKMEVMNPEKKSEKFVLVTYWEDKESWKDWYKGHQFKESHEAMPSGLKLVPKSTKLTFYNTIPISTST